MTKHTGEEQESLTKFMQENNLTSESKLVRYTSKDHLKESDGHLYLNAKQDPMEMVVDRYHGSSEVFIASEIGPGLAFLSEKEEEYEIADRICVEIVLKDVLDQGGLVYIVTSLPPYLKAFYCTLPDGKVKVEIICG